MKLNKIQSKLVNKIKTGFKKENKGILCSTCGTGQTIMALFLKIPKKTKKETL